MLIHYFFLSQVVPINGPINHNHCWKLYKLVYKEENGRLKFSNLPWSNSNCYLFYTKSFESQIEANEFCRTAFGEKYIGELAYGIGVDLQAAHVRSNLYVLLKFYSKWNYMKLGILDKIDDFTCQCTTDWFRPESRRWSSSFKEYWKFDPKFGQQQIESIGLRKDTICPMHRKNGCSADVYDITTICEVLSKRPGNE